MAFYVGKFGTVTVGGSQKPLTDWDVDFKAESIDVTNFMSSGWQELLGGIFSAEVTASGPYNGVSSVTQGALVLVALDVDGGSAGPTFTGSALATSVKVSQNVKGVAMVNYTFSSSGAWTVHP